MKPAVVIDVPEGWKYGFPKVLPENISPEDIDAWIISEGYPQKLIGEYGKHFYYRFWNKEIDNE